MDWVPIIFGTQVIKKKRPARPVFPDYLSVSYDYGLREILKKAKIDVLCIDETKLDSSFKLDSSSK